VSGADKRRHTRYKVQKDACCYIDGFRVDVRSEDISAGGMFLATPGARPEQDIEVAIVFGEHSGSPTPTFLFGRVVRLQDEPVRGVGIRWEKAVTIGDLRILEGFLAATLGIPVPDIRERAMPRVSGRKWVYSFPLPEGAAPPERKEGDEAAAPPFLGGPPIDLPPPATAAPPAGGTGAGSAEAPGSLTSLIEMRASQATAAIDATMTWRDSTQTVRITRIGLFGMFVQSPFMPVARDADLVVRFVATSGGIPQIIECSCRITGIAADVPGLELEIGGVNERGATGAFKAFLKRLEFRSLATS